MPEKNGFEINFALVAYLNYWRERYKKMGLSQNKIWKLMERRRNKF